MLIAALGSSFDSTKPKIRPRSSGGSKLSRSSLQDNASVPSQPSHLPTPVTYSVTIAALALARLRGRPPSWADDQDCWQRTAPPQR